jgi:hypothetical protein
MFHALRPCSVLVHSRGDLYATSRQFARLLGTKHPGASRIKKTLAARGFGPVEFEDLLMWQSDTSLRPPNDASDMDKRQNLGCQLNVAKVSLSGYMPWNSATARQHAEFQSRNKSRHDSQATSKI